MFTYPMFSPAGGGSATSVETVEITLDGSTTTDTVNLTLGQNYAQCVPFVTWRGNDTGDWNEVAKGSIDVKIIDNSGTAAIKVERYESTGGMSVFITAYILELNDDFNVQQISYGNPLSGQNFTVACTAVDTDHTFLLEYARRTIGGTAALTDEYSAKVTFNSSTQVQFTRQDADNSMVGTLYVVEDGTGGDHFSVQTASSSQTNTGTYDVSITAIDKDTSFIIGTYSTNDVGVAEDFAFTCELLDDDTVRFVVRGDNGDNRDMHAQVVTWLDETVSVQHVSDNYVCDTTENAETNNVSITTVDEDNSIFFVNTKNWQNINALIDSHGSTPPASQTRCRIASGGGSVNIERYTNTVATTSRFRGWVAEFSL